MRLLVCGGRDYEDYDRIIEVLGRVHAKHGVTLLIEGGAKGADAHASIWADSNYVHRCTFHANWTHYGNKAGPIRNQAMIDHGNPDAVVAFPGGSGTSDMIKRARAAGLPVWELTE